MENSVIKNISYNIYKLLYRSLLTPGANVTDWKYFINNINKCVMDIDEINAINYLYKIDSLKIKLLLFLIWDFESYCGLNNIDNLKVVVEVFNCYILRFDSLLYDLDDEKINKFLNNNNNDFLNIDNNLSFWKKWYNICESFLNTSKNDKISILYNENYYKVIDGIRLKYNIDRTMDIEKEEMEDEMKVWLILLINNLREEWLNSSFFKKRKEEFYWSLLYELENISLKKNER